jgi:adenine phosphoribosyltransferase
MTLTTDLLNTIQDFHDFPKPGIIFKDINPVLKNAQLMKRIIADMAVFAQSVAAQHIIGVESRGFFFALPLALEMNLPFIPARKKGKLPGSVVSETYSLEYGEDSLEIQASSIVAGQRYLIVDDIIATGGTVCAVAKIIQKENAVLAGCSFLSELTFLNGTKKILETAPNCKIQSILKI